MHSINFSNKREVGGNNNINLKLSNILTLQISLLALRHKALDLTKVAFSKDLLTVDSMLTSYLLQATDHRGLQAQNCNGQWIDCPPIRGTVVVALGQGLESITQGICTSTTHRVISPPAGQGARFSIPFFQGVGLDATFESMKIAEDV